MVNEKTKEIGIKVKMPGKSCNDKKCPFHGNLRVRGRTFYGIVIAKDVHKSATVQWDRLFNVPKYERFEKRRTKVRVHNPPCINAEKGDKVMIMECRSLSKTKNFVIVQNLGKEFGFEQREEALEESKVPEKEKEKEVKENIKEKAD
ncbi:MAG: 30S ribosomal protein S17 [Nanoarchaeota archaeon]|nr:30S ribosomal protein S17 [Nanoarchaeota archaeon]